MCLAAVSQGFGLRGAAQDGSCWVHQSWCGKSLQITEAEEPQWGRSSGVSIPAAQLHQSGSARLTCMDGCTGIHPGHGMGLVENLHLLAFIH